MPRAPLSPFVVSGSDRLVAQVVAGGGVPWPARHPARTSKLHRSVGLLVDARPQPAVTLALVSDVRALRPDLPILVSCARYDRELVGALGALDASVACEAGAPAVAEAFVRRIVLSRAPLRHRLAAAVRETSEEIGGDPRLARILDVIAHTNERDEIAVCADLTERQVKRGLGEILPRLRARHTAEVRRMLMNHAWNLREFG